MKVSNEFKNTIEKHLNDKSFLNNDFAIHYKKEGKNLDDCCSYILQKVEESGNNGFADSEIFGMAEEYYTLDNVVIKESKNMRVVVNHTVEKPVSTYVPPKPKVAEPAKPISPTLF
jgi:hypothetical protein